MKEVDLPSGKKAKIRKGKGADLVKAQMMAEGEPYKMQLGMIAAVTQIDDKPVTLEDLMDMDWGDVLTILNFLELPQNLPQMPSSPSPPTETSSTKKS